MMTGELACVAIIYLITSRIGLYQYTGDLLQLGRARRPEVHEVQNEIAQICSPLSDALTQWQSQLHAGPPRSTVLSLSNLGTPGGISDWF